MKDHVTEKIFTIPELVKILGYHRLKITMLIESGKLKGFNSSTGKKRKYWQVTESNLKNFLEGK